MRFYGREEELQTLSNFLQIVRKKHLSQMVAVTGRRRVGKTTLILKAFEKEKDAVPVFYFFVERLPGLRRGVSTRRPHGR